ncbi:MAG: dihydroorotase [Candidatus Electryoneaceae bacterium]|nr:dihydroorotase [Candidatus Electryoneaceae bacterium]
MNNTESTWSNLVPINPPDGWRTVSTEKLAIRGARIIDTNLNIDQVTDLIIHNGRIDRIGDIPDDWNGETIDARGWIMVPGLFDMHVHLREPGYEHKETVQSGSMAAAVGGFTGVACMPNTDPTIDNLGGVQFVREQNHGLPTDVHPIAAVTCGRKGEMLVNFAELARAGVTAFSDDGTPVKSAELMRRALEYTKMLNCVIIEHSEEQTLSGDGVMHEGAMSTRLGLPGWPSIAEEIAIERNIRLAEYTGGKLHIAHVSTAGSAELIRQAKSRGVTVTAEVTPHHLTLDCRLLEGFDSDYKVNPPLRTQDDVEAMIEALADGTIDVVATDHAPHARFEKEVEFIHAPFGMLGLETALGVLLTKLVRTERLSLERIINAMTQAPRRILNFPQVRIESDRLANLTLFDPEAVWTVDRKHMVSKSDNTPYHGWELTGRSQCVVNRNIAWIRE